MKAAPTWKSRCDQVRSKTIAIVRFIQRQPELQEMLDTVNLILIVLLVLGGF